MWGADVQQNAIIYMDNSAAGWDYSNIYFVINSTNGYPMTAVANTKLYVHKRSAGTWSGYSNVRFFAATASWGGDDASMGSESNMASYGANLTNTQTNYGFNGNNYYAIKLNKKGAKESGSRANLSTSYIGNAISSMNKTMTIKAKISTDGGSSYSAGNTPGKLTAASFKFTTYNSCSSATSATVNAGSASSTLSVGYTADLTLTAVDVDGYDFIGWSSGTNASTNVGTTKTVTVNPTVATTYYAWYREKRYDVKVATITPSAGGSATPTSWTAMGIVTGGNITATPNTGYSFSGWSILSGGGGYFGESGTATTSSTANTKFRPTKSSSLKATFTANSYTFTLNGNEGSDGSVTIKYDSDAPTSISHSSRAGYSLNGYYTAASGGTKVINANGSLNNVSGWVSGGYWKQTDETQVLYAQWTENAVYYTLNFTYGTSSTGYVAVTAKNSSTEAAISYGASLLSGTGVTVTATPETHYKFVGWYSNAACTSSVSTDNPYSFTISANTNLYAKVERMTTTVTFNKNGGSGSTPATLTATHGSNSLSSGYVAPTRTGYTFNGWYDAESGGNKVFGTNGVITASSGYADGSSNWTYTESTLTVYAHWTEETSTLTTSNLYDAGDPSYAAPTKSVSSIGISTTATVTATTPSAGYTFAGWTLSSNLVVTSGNKDTDLSITIRTNGNGAAATAQANYEEVLTSTYYVEGDASGPFTQGWNANASTMMMKRSGSASSSDVYWTVDVPAAKTSPGDTQWEFKIYNSAGANDNAKWLGWGTGGDFYWLTKANHSLTLSTSGSNNIRFKPYVEGTYTFHVNYSTPSSPTLEVIWPVVNQLRISAASPTDATNTNNFDLSDQGSNNWSVTRTLNAKTTYTFKMVYDGEWYGKNSTALTRASNTASSLSNSGADMTIQTDAEGSYTFTFNSSTKNLTVTYPAAHTITFGAGNHNGSNSAITATASPSFSSGDYVLDATSVTFNKGTTKTGYTWNGWYSKSDGTGTKHSATDGSWTSSSRDANLSVYACYNLVTYTITYNLNGGSNPVSPAPATSYNIESAAITLPTPTKTGYTFNGWYTNEVLTAGPVTTISTGSTGNKTYWAKWTPKQTTITLNNVDATTAGSTEVTATYDAAMPAITLPTKTGYTFGGYWGAPGGSGPLYYNADGSSAQNWDNENATYTLFAKWTAKSYTVTLDYDETNHGDITTTPPTSSVTATYGAEMPEIAILPKATEGYGFMGYYSAAGGSGTQYYDGTGASVTNWNVDDNVTLYAYYKKAEITVNLAAAVVAPWTEESPSSVTATPTLNPRPEGDTKICWFLLQNNNNPVEPQPSFTPGEGNSVSFPAPTVSGNYKVVATLRTGTSCDGGTLLDADTAIFTVAGEHTVTILYKCGDDVIKASTTSPGKPLEGTSITAPDIIGYSFHHWVLGDGVSLASGTAGSAGSAGTATISYTAIYDGHITAVYTKKNMIYFNNTLGWSDVYVYFYNTDEYWDNTYGSGAKQSQAFNGDHKPYWEQEHGHMTQIEGTNIWYFDYTGAGYSTRTNVVFTEANQHNNQWFWKTKAVRRGDHKSSLPMFVPLAVKSSTKNQTDYYNEGYWMNYPENTGYVLKIYNSKTYGTSDEMQSIPFEFTADKTMPMSLTVELNANREYGFEIHRADGISYGNNSKVMKINDSGDNGSPWAATSGKRTGLKTSVAGEYIFTLSFGNNGGYNYLVGVHYPVAQNDYRIVYNDRVTWSHSTAHSASWHHPSRAIHKENGAKDTVSFYVSKADGASASMKFQYASSITNEGVVTWTDVDGGSINLSGIENSGVYNFILTQSAVSIRVEKIEPYTGAYYIRTDCAAPNKWDNYRAADHQMTYSEFSKSRETNKFGDLFSHYFTKWCPRGTNIKFTVANDYSSCVSDTLIQDEAFDGSISDFENVDGNGTLKNHGEGDPSADPYSANIRFMYDESNNRIKRAYVSSSTNTDKKFLVLQGDAKLRDKDGNAIAATANLEANAVLFQDDQNWIYEAIVKAVPGARIKIYAKYLAGLSEEADQFFCGASGEFDNAHTVELLGGSGSTPMLVRVIYDFKTNRLVCAWIPDGSEIDGDNAINADIMVVREHQDAAQTITFANDDSKLSSVKTVYGAMKFNRWVLNNRQHPEDINPEHCRAASIESDLTTYHPVLSPAEQKSIYERSLYFISFPFRVKLSEVFGFGKYWDEWYIEYYDGLNRAKNGYWMDSPPNWKYVTPDMLNSFYLEPNVGYILGLDLDFMQAENTKFWANGICNVELYFPSQESIETIGRTAVKMPALGDEYKCTINRGTAEGDRRVKDSYWRCIGVPGYSSYNNTLTVDGSNEFSWQTNTAWREDFKDYPFLYEWNMTDNTLTAQSTNRYNFKAMHAYLVQNGNEIHWSAISATPVSPIVARERAASKTEYMWRLTLERDGEEEDQAFIRMTDDEDVTDGFDFGQDLAKEYNNARSDIYTYIGYERAAANSMPLHTEETTSIPVGVSIEKDGEYTFAMPDGTSGVGITLVDSETGARTNLSAGFTYTVNFEKGDYNNRLYLEISPVSQISTGVGAVSDQSSEIRKVVIDGLLYIVKDGQMYDATGKHCK